MRILGPRLCVKSAAKPAFLRIFKKAAEKLWIFFFSTCVTLAFFIRQLRKNCVFFFELQKNCVFNLVAFFFSFFFPPKAVALS